MIPRVGIVKLGPTAKHAGTDRIQNIKNFIETKVLKPIKLISTCLDLNLRLLIFESQGLTTRLHYRLVKNLLIFKPKCCC